MARNGRSACLPFESRLSTEKHQPQQPGEDHLTSSAKQRPRPTPKKHGRNAGEMEQEHCTEVEDLSASPSPSGSQRTEACDPAPPDLERTPPLQGAYTQVFPTVERTLGQPTSMSTSTSTLTPLSPSSNPGRQLTVVPHPNPLRDVRMGEQQPLPRPPSQATAPRRSLAPTLAGPSNMPQRLPTPSFHPAIGHIQHPTPSSQSLDCRSAPQEQHHQFTPPPNNGADTLDPGDIESIPKPDNLSQKNLRAEMGLDHTPEAIMYYNKIRNVVRGHMSEWYWMDWASLPEDKRKSLYIKVYNDPRIPIIKRYQDHWATEGIAKTTASGRRKRAYCRGDAEPPKRFAYNVANSAKRDPVAPRGRWDSVSQSVKPKGKRTNVRHVVDEERAQDISAASLEPLDRGGVNATNVDIADTHSLAYNLPGPSGLQDAGPSQINPQRHSSCSSLQPGLTHTRGELADSSASAMFGFGVNDGASSTYHSFRLSPPRTQNNAIVDPRPQMGWYQQQLGRLGDEPSTSAGSQPAPRFLPHFVAGNPTSSPVSQPPSPMDGLYTFDVDDKCLEPPDRDEDESDGPEN